MSIEIHPIQSQSFAIIDQEIGEHSFTSAEYAIVESKIMLAQTSVEQIRVEGRKGGSPVAAAILNALIVLAANEK